MLTAISNIDAKLPNNDAMPYTAEWLANEPLAKQSEGVETLYKPSSTEFPVAEQDTSDESLAGERDGQPEGNGALHQVLAEAQKASLVSQATEDETSVAVNPAHSPSPSLDDSASSDQDDSEADDSRIASMPGPIHRSQSSLQQRQVKAAVQKERRRRQILPKIAKEDRCGHCHHCKNPKLKKACITARKLQMKSLDDKEELPLFYKIADNKLDSKAVPPVRPRPAPTSQQVEVNDQLQRLLTTVDGQVMIKPGKQQHFIDLMHRPQMKWAVRIFFLKTIPALPTSDKTLLVNMADCKGLTILHTWLNLAAERPSDAERFTLDVLKTLGVLPVDMAALKKVPIGKTVNNLAKKDPSQKVKAAAGKVVLQWRKNVGMVGNDSKRTRDVDANVDGAPAKKLKQEPGASVAPSSGLVKTASADSSQFAATGLTGQNSTDSAQAASTAADVNGTGTAFPHADSRDVPSSGVLPMEVDDDAMFQKKQPTVKIEPTQDHKVQRLDLSEVAKLGRDNAQPAADADIKLEDVKQEEPMAVHVKESVKQENANAEDVKAEPENAKPAKGPAGLGGPKGRLGSTGSSALGSTRIGASSSSTRIGGLGSIGLGSLGTFSGLGRQSTAVRTAADRAAEAAARIPDPPPGTPRLKRKSVGFVEDGQLACIRYFFKAEPAINVRADPDFTAAESSDAAALQQNAEEPSEDHPPEFKSAARQEHMDEAAAIRRQMQGGAAAQDEDETNELLESMAPTQQWATPPLNPPPAPDADPIAAGEDSTESTAEAQRIQTVQAFPLPNRQLMEHELPQDPFLPIHAEQDVPLDYTLAIIVLHTPKELADQAAAQQQQQQQQQQQLHQQPMLSQQPPPGRFQQPQGMSTYAPAVQPPGLMQQPGGVMQPAAQPPRPPGGPGPRPSLQHAMAPQHVHGPAGPGGAPFRPSHGGVPPPSVPHLHQTPNVMRPMQVQPGGADQQVMEAPPFGEVPRPAGGQEVQLPTLAKPSSALCKFFNTPKGCSRGETCGFKHVRYEPAGRHPPEFRPADVGPPPRRNEPASRGRASRDGPPHPARSSGGHGDGPSWQQSRKCAFFNTPKGCAKGDRCQFAHVREDVWDGPEMQHDRSDRGNFAAERGDRRERDRHQTQSEWHAPSRKSSGWDQRPNG